MNPLKAHDTLLHPRYGSLAQERPRRLVIGHVLLRGHARNGAAGLTTSRARSSNDLKRTQPLPMSSFLPLFLYSLVNQVGESGMTEEPIS